MEYFRARLEIVWRKVILRKVGLSFGVDKAWHNVRWNGISLAGVLLWYEATLLTVCGGMIYDLGAPWSGWLLLGVV